QRAQTDGKVNVIVGLAVPWTPERKGNRQAALTQRGAIRAAQRDLINELSPVSHKVRRQFQSVPYISLEASAATLAVLDHSPRVTKVTEVHRLRPLLYDSVPLVGADQRLG